MTLDDCTTCFFFCGEHEGFILCNCYRELTSLPIVPMAFGMREVILCPLDLQNK